MLEELIRNFREPPPPASVEWIEALLRPCRASFIGERGTSLQELWYNILRFLRFLAQAEDTGDTVSVLMHPMMLTDYSRSSGLFHGPRTEVNTAEIPGRLIRMLQENAKNRSSRAWYHVEKLSIPGTVQATVGDVKIAVLKEERVLSLDPRYLSTFRIQRCFLGSLHGRLLCSYHQGNAELADTSAGLGVSKSCSEHVLPL